MCCVNAHLRLARKAFLHKCAALESDQKCGRVTIPTYLVSPKGDYNSLFPTNTVPYELIRHATICIHMIVECLVFILQCLIKTEIILGTLQRMHCTQATRPYFSP